MAQQEDIIPADAENAVNGTGDAVWSKNRRDEFVPVYLKNN